MRSEVQIKLSQTYTAHKIEFNKLTLMEPLGKDYDDIGDVTEIQYSNGVPFIDYRDERVLEYRSRLLKKGEGLPTEVELSELKLVDAIAVKDAIVNFFQTAREKLSAQRKTNSSSNADGNQSS